MSVKTSWNFELLLKDFSEEKFNQERALIDQRVDNFVEKWQGMPYLDDSAMLLEGLNDYEAIFSSYGLDGVFGLYYALSFYLDQTDSKTKAILNKIDSHARDLYNKLQFFSHSISKATEEQKELLYGDPILSEYNHFLFKLFLEGEYLLSEPEEKILLLKSKTSGVNWVQMTQMLLSKEEVVVKTNSGETSKSFSELVSLMDDQDKSTRDAAASEFNRIMEKWSDVAEVEINSILENKQIDDELRGIERPDFPRHLSDDIESSVVDSLLYSVVDRYDISRRYYELKARILGVERLEYHERNLEIGKITKKYSFEEAVAIVERVFGRLDPDFLRIFKNFLDNGQIDVYPKKGKASGAFCLSDVKANPIFILLNFTSKLNDVLTIAHEVGHGIHFEMAKKQNALNFGASLATAEVASTFMEDFVLEELISDADDETKLEIMMVKLNDDISTIFRQIACYRFEQALHRDFRTKGYLSKQEIGDLFRENMSDYMGDAVEQSEGSQNWWVYWSHIRSFFYVYSYASGLLISKSLQSAVRANPETIKSVKAYFEAGESDSVKNIFLGLGIDITQQSFWVRGLEEIEEHLNQAEALAKKLGKI